jgi:hypothetical protein
MEVTKLILEFTKALAWPLASLVIAFIFREPISSILSRIRKAGLPGGVSVDFEEEIREAQVLSERVGSDLGPPGRPSVPTIPLTETNARMISVGLRPTPSGLDMSYYRAIAGSDPNLALAGLRMEPELLANNVADGFKMTPRKTEPLSSLLSRLKVHGAITSEQAQLARKILRLCNEALHGRQVSRAEADEVIDAAAVLFDQYLNWLSWGWPDRWSPKTLPRAVLSASELR